MKKNGKTVLKKKDTKKTKKKIPNCNVGNKNPKIHPIQGKKITKKGVVLRWGDHSYNQKKNSIKKKWVFNTPISPKKPPNFSCMSGMAGFLKGGGVFAFFFGNSKKKTRFLKNWFGGF
ncbi:hypothetical protein ACFFWB_26910 [Flavobacterium procerum]|uniref:hypothetical protein n=1 Tax=Flavobacterium procerum TaxID=1455569 RepID=UPI0035E890CC